jgi:hypothetical protein
MMTLDDALITKAAGIAGACISLAYMKGPLYMRLTNAVGGAIVSLYATPWAALKTGAPEGLAGFLLGLFGMAICAKGWEIIEATPVKEVWTSLLSKFGVK